MSTIERAYLVCATPRSGSTLLCELLKATGVAGRPGEYFETLRSTGYPRQPRQYFEGLPEVQALLPEVDPGTPERAFDWDAVLRAGTTAIQTQHWRDEGDNGETRDPVYSFAAIRHLAQQLTAHELAWDEWLLGRDAIDVPYEELAAAPGLRPRGAGAARHRRRGRRRVADAPPVRRALARVDRTLRTGGGMSTIVDELVLTPLEALAAEAVYAMREVAAELERPVLLFRDPKGLYARARAGRLAGLTGDSAPYEPPEAAELVVPGAEEAVEAAARRVLEAIGG